MGRRLERSGGPWVVGADWNLEVDDLIVDRWPEVVGGLVRAGDPSLGACVVSTPASNIDFFVVSSDLGAIVGPANIDVSGTTWPHRSVIAQLDLSQRRVPTQLMCQPKPEWKECNASDDKAEDDTPAQVKATCAQGPIARHSGDYATALTAAVAILHNTQHSLAQGPNRSRGGAVGQGGGTPNIIICFHMCIPRFHLTFREGGGLPKRALQARSQMLVPCPLKNIGTTQTQDYATVARPRLEHHSPKDGSTDEAYNEWVTVAVEELFCNTANGLTARQLATAQSAMGREFAIR